MFYVLKLTRGHFLFPLSTGISNAQGLAIDWVSRNMYWTNVNEDPKKSSIHIARLDGSFRNEIEVGELHNPRSIVIEPMGG